MVFYPKLDIDTVCGIHKETHNKPGTTETIGVLILKISTEKLISYQVTRKNGKRDLPIFMFAYSQLVQIVLF